jgi:hypothetical protein
MKNIIFVILVTSITATLSGQVVKTNTDKYGAKHQAVNVHGSTTRQWSDNEIKSMASQYEYLKDSIHTTKFKSNIEFLSKVKDKNEIKACLELWNNHFRKKLENTDFQKEQ